MPVTRLAVAMVAMLTVPAGAQPGRNRVSDYQRHPRGAVSVLVNTDDYGTTIVHVLIGTPLGKQHERIKTSDVKIAAFDAAGRELRQRPATNPPPEYLFAVMMGGSATYSAQFGVDASMVAVAKVRATAEGQTLVFTLRDEPPPKPYRPKVPDSC